MPSTTGFSPLSLHDALPILLTNAAKFSPAGSPIEVSLRAVDGYAVVSVSDHGPGIAEEDRLRIFTRFYRGDSNVARSTRGAGIRSEEHTSELQSRRDLVCRLPPGSPLFPYTTLFRSC